MLVVDDARPVRSLVAEQLGAEAVDHALDYERYGPELAYVLLCEASVRPGRGPTLESLSPDRVPLTVRSSEPLREEVSNPLLRAHLDALAGTQTVTL